MKRKEQEQSRVEGGILKKLGSIVKGIGAAFMFLFALAFMPSFSSVIFLVLGVLLLPIAKWQDFLRTYVNRKIKTIVSVVLFVVALAVTPAAETPDDTRTVISTDAPEATLEDTTVALPTEERTTAESTTEEITTEEITTEEPTTEEATTEELTTEEVTTEEPTTEAPTTEAPTTQAPTTEAEPEQETMVWISKTGKKYHSNPNCSNMKNPSQITLSEALSRGKEACSKCY